MNSIEELVRAAQAGRREAFAQLVGRYQRAVIATAWSVLNDFHAAQDAAQDSFVIAFEQLGRLRNPDTFGPWLLTISRREALRRAKRGRETTGLQDDMPTAPDVDSVRIQEHEELTKSIGRLPEHEREVVVFHYLEGYSAREIAEFTGRPTGTVTKQLSRAVARLRKWVAQVPQ